MIGTGLGGPLGQSGTRTGAKVGRWRHGMFAFRFALVLLQVGRVRCNNVYDVSSSVSGAMARCVVRRLSCVGGACQGCSRCSVSQRGRKGESVWVEVNVEGDDDEDKGVVVTGDMVEKGPSATRTRSDTIQNRNQ